MHLSVYDAGLYVSVYVCEGLFRALLCVPCGYGEAVCVREQPTKRNGAEPGLFLHLLCNTHTHTTLFSHTHTNSLCE